MPPTTRRQRQTAKVAMAKTRRQRKEMQNVNGTREQHATPRKERTEEIATSDEDEDAQVTYTFDGKEYGTYQAMVDAKRQRNRDMMAKSGLLAASNDMREAAKKAVASKRGIMKKRKKNDEPPLPRRKSSRLAGVQADGLYVDSERSGKFIVRGLSKGPTGGQGKEYEKEEEAEFNGRINDGSALTIKDAAELVGPKWIRENSVESAEKFVRNTLASRVKDKKRASKQSPTSVTAFPSIDSLRSKLDSLSVDDETNVAKVTPDRIYSVACHPSQDTLLVGAGDKQGFVGLWNVDQHMSEGSSNNSTEGVHLFHLHSRPVCCLEWTKSGNALLSASYDGSVRWFDVQSEKFEQLFATYDNSTKYRSELGRGLDEGWKYWAQYATLDHRNSSEQCFFLSTSAGTAMHVDLRVGNGRLSFHEVLSEKKINTVSLHANGTALATAGLDCAVRIWDIRKFGDSRSHSGRSKKHKAPTPLATQRSSKSINSAFFSPSGGWLLTTTMANTLDLMEDAHLANDTITNTKRIRHDNMTGRWLSTFMAKWHSHHDIFVVGSMQRPRTIEVFDAGGTLLRGIQGEALTAVASRCCFHPSQNKFVLVGGNSSGRVTVVR